MKKPLAIILAFFIVFSPVYSYAVLPALIASAASAAGRVLVGNGVKKVSQTALSRGGMSALGICQRNPIQCIGLAVAIYDALRDKGYTVEEGDNITNNNIDIEIYKIAPAECELIIGYDQTVSPSDSLPTLQNLYSSAVAKGGNGYTLSSLPEASSIMTNHYNSLLATIPVPTPIQLKWKQIGSSVVVPMLRKNNDGSGQSVLNLSAYGYYKCLPYPDNKTYITDNEFYQIMQNNVSADDIKNIYNYDYSQHPTITINNNSYGGNSINNDLSVSADPEFKVSPSLKLDIESNKVSMDDINDENCTKNEQGEYDKCGDTEPTDPEPTDPTDPEPPKPSPIECDANGFYRKVCDWMDWTQTNHDTPEPSIVDIIDQSEDLTIDQNRINFSNQCPAPTSIRTSVGGFPVSTELNYQPLCDFFTMLNPFVVGMGGISSALIIAGGARRG